jgi:rubrerythrin
MSEEKGDKDGLLAMQGSREQSFYTVDAEAVGSNVMRCHKCGYWGQNTTGVCPDCGGDMID